MIDVGIALVLAVLLWWASTGAILYLDGLPQPTHKWSFFAILACGVAGMCGIVWSRGDATAFGACVAFTSALAVWAVPTAAFYLGVVTGPRRAPMAAGLHGIARFRAASETVIHNELLCLVLGALVVALVAGQANTVALCTYAMLWIMHVSGKLNMFFGVRNLSEEFLPAHLSYLPSYMRQRPMNLFFPLSTTLTTALVLWCASVFWAATSGSYQAVAAVLLGVLALLALLEHWLLVLPIAPMTLWTWTLRAREPGPSSSFKSSELLETDTNQTLATRSGS